MASRTVVVAVACVALVAFAPLAFVPAPRAQPSTVEAAGFLAAGAAVAPQAANAFTFEGEEYFDIYFGIEPAAWALCGFIILTFAGFLKTSVAKYNVPVSKEPLKKKFVPLQQERPGNFVDQKISGFDTTF
mmetsp:Transcript_62678/g.116568  ORF Transcript_62678/g.116568 Transcript_62678/m.116568 type:complete len:131 (-) Transcript_62678:91-483(-)